MAGDGRIELISRSKIKVLFCASEVAPFEKTGGLADVAGSLPLALGKLGVETLVLMPKYRGIELSKKKLSPNVTVRFVRQEEFFNRSSPYGNEGGDYPDNLERFSFFCHEALHLCKQAGFKPDIVHAHDWQTALLPVLLKTKFAQDPFFKKTRSVLTIHNIAYQGNFPAKKFGLLGLDPGLFSVEGFEFYGKISFLKAGLLYADRITTVSPTYAEEIQTRDFGFGLEGVVHRRAGHLRGILNGLDYGIWDPAKDKRIQKKYSWKELQGKKDCKRALQKQCRFEVDEDIPLFGMVTRLAEQKGLDILSEACEEFLSQKAQFVLLGEGDRVYHTTFRNVAVRHPKNTAVFLTFNAAEAHAIYAGADFFPMPSYFEPCGLGQMIAMKYGALPIARQTGGLADTVVDADEANGNGFIFKEPSPEKFLEAILRARMVFEDKKKLAALQKRAMKADFSWEKSAGHYLKLYRETVKT